MMTRPEAQQAAAAILLRLATRLEEAEQDRCRLVERLTCDGAGRVHGDVELRVGEAKRLRTIARAMTQ